MSISTRYLSRAQKGGTCRPDRWGPFSHRKSSPSIPCKLFSLSCEDLLFSSVGTEARAKTRYRNSTTQRTTPRPPCIICGRLNSSDWHRRRSRRDIAVHDWIRVSRPLAARKHLGSVIRAQLLTVHKPCIDGNRAENQDVRHRRNQIAKN